MGNRWDGIPADAFVQILQRLPPSPIRWRLRLVCRHWRKVIDDRTPRPPQARAKVLVFAAGWSDGSRAYVFDDLEAEQGCGGRAFNLPGCATDSDVSMVGTCNGLVCLRRRHGDVVVVNPVTGEKLAVPPPSKTSEVSWDAATYSFAYHPATGLYKIVHFPFRRGNRDGMFAAVNVITLGDRSWREVPVPVGSSCLLSSGLVSVDGATYWVSKDERSVMSFDLKDERVVFVAALPVRALLYTDHPWHLVTDLRGRLGLVELKKRSRTVEDGKTEVWILEDRGRNKRRPWVLRYTVVEPGRTRDDNRAAQHQEIARPHAIHGGEHVLTTRAEAYGGVRLHAHRLSEARKNGGVAKMERTPPTMGMYNGCDSLRTFAHVETTEPLALYGWEDWVIGDNERSWSWTFDSREARWKLTVRMPSPWAGFR